MFEIFDVFNMPVPMSNPQISEKQLPGMVARYHLEADSIAINLKEMKYVLYQKLNKNIVAPHYTIIVT